MTECPFLLRYKVRDCQCGLEREFDSSKCGQLDDWDRMSGWESYESPKFEIWKLRLSDTGKFMKDSCGVIKYFCRHEIHAPGIAQPVMIRFRPYPNNRDKTSEALTYSLPERFEIKNDPAWQRGDDFIACVSPVLQEYERCRDIWQTRVIVSR